MRKSGVFPVRWAPKDGEKGHGVTIKSTSVRYAASTSGTSHPTLGWSEKIPSVSNGNYLWTWTHVEYSDDTTTDAYSVSRMGIDGKGIQSSKVTYSQQKDNVSPESITDWGAFPTKLTDGYWLYTKTHIVYSDNSATDSYSVAQVGVGSYYAGVSEYYAAGSKADTVPDGAAKAGTYANGTSIQTTWKQERPTLTEAEPYLWNFEISADSRGNKYVTEARCIGNFAKGIKSIVEAYALSNSGSLGANGEPAITGTWTDEPQDCAPTSDYPYQWNRTTITYNNGDTDVTYHVSAVRGDDGKGSVYIDFDNDNDTMLYDGAGNLLSGNSVSQGTLLEGGDDVTASVTEWKIEETTGGVAATIKDGKVTITGITQTSGTVKVRATYNGKYYYAVITIKRLVGVDKFDIVCSPNAITYNSTTKKPSASSVKIEVYRTGQNGQRTLVQSLSLYHLTIRGYTDNSDNYTTVLTGRYNSGVSLIVYPDTYSQYRFELVDKDDKVLDSETIPISKTANGDSGRGIASQTSYFTATDKATLAKKTDISDSYWSTVFPTTQVTEQQPYVWKSVYTVYTSGDPTWSTPELVATYRAGVNQNLLENAAFRDDSHMGAWYVKSQYSSSSLKDDYTGSHIITSKNTSLPAGKNNRNYYHDTTKYRQSEAAYKECLQQLLYDTSTKKLQPNTWYTLSFWYKCGSTSMSINQTSNGYGFATQKLYLVTGHKYVLFIAGYISQTAKDKGKKLRVHIYRDNAGDNNWSWGGNGKQAGVPFVDIDNVGSSVENRCTIGGSGCDFGEVPQTGEYLLSAYLYPNDSDRSTVDYGTATFSYVRLHDLTAQADTYVYPSCVDTNSPAYVDGVEVKAPSDMAVAIDGEQWNDGGGNQVWKRRIITFKTKSISASQYVLWRLMPSPISGQQVFLSVCMPKLEEGMFATGFVDTYEDTEGLQGCLLRDFIWQEGYECHNDEKLVSWPRYLDIAYIEESVGVWKVYQCLKTHTSSADKKPGTSGGASFWKVVDNMGPLYTPLLLADNAKIKIGQTNQFLITDSDNNIVGCLQGDISKPIFYIQEPQSGSGISMGVDDHGNPYIMGNSRDVEQANNTDYAFLLDPARGIFDFYGPSLQHFCVNGDGLSYWDEGGKEIEIDTMGGFVFYGQYFDIRNTQSLVLPYPEIRYGSNKTIAGSSITLYEDTSSGRVQRLVYIDDKGYLRIDMDTELWYDETTKTWKVGDVTQRQ